MRILITEDHVIVRQGLRLILADRFKNAVFGEARNATEALACVWKEKWDVVLLDITMPGRSGLEVLKEIKRLRPRLPVLILSMHRDESYVLRALRAGARGYLLKDSPRDDVLSAIRTVAAGRSYLSRQVSQILQEDYVRQLESRGLEDSYDLLTDREREILQLLAEGKANKEVANLLNISPTTVETHRAHILQKLSLHSTADLILYAVRKRIIC